MKRWSNCLLQVRAVGKVALRRSNALCSTEIRQQARLLSRGRGRGRNHGVFSVDRSNLINYYDNQKPSTKADTAASKSNASNDVTKESLTPLAKELIEIIQWRGPISIHDYITQAANNRSHGYYQNQAGNKIGEKGDFVTAPEVSQLFGEIVGIWCYLSWLKLGSPKVLDLIELGPGKGTMMKDIVRVARRFPSFSRALQINMVELSQTMRKMQYKTLVSNSEPNEIQDNLFNSISLPESNEVDLRIRWFSHLRDIPSDHPCLIVGQEFLDTFPVHQFVYTRQGWREKLIDINSSVVSPTTGTVTPAPVDAERTPYHFRFVLSPSTTPAFKSLSSMQKIWQYIQDHRLQAIQQLLRALPVELQHAISKQPHGEQSSNPDNHPSSSSLPQWREGDSVEVSPLSWAAVEEIARRVNQCRGLALMIDYGEDYPQDDTLRGFYQHKQLHVLSQPGSVDVTADVDFATCRFIAAEQGALVSPLLTQSTFLMQLGIVQRVEYLINLESTSEEQANTLVSSFKTLVDPQLMGCKFKVLCIGSQDLNTPVQNMSEDTTEEYRQLVNLSTWPGFYTTS